MNHEPGKQVRNGPFAGCIYRDRGKGFPLLLLHGFPMDGDIWHQHADLLAEAGHRVIVPDLPGSGRSPLPAGPVTIEGMADFVYAILLQERLEQCILFGHSMGGYVTLAFAEKFPQLLKGAGLINSTAMADTEEKKQARLKSIRLMEQYGTAAFVRQTVPGYFGEKFRNGHPETISGLVEKYSSAGVEALKGYYLAMMQRPDRVAVLEKAAFPFLFIIGKEDKAAPLDMMLRQVALPAVASIHIFDGVGHMAMLEAAAQTGRLLRDFAGYCLPSD